MSAAESTGELGYSGLVTPSPPLSIDGHSHSPVSATTMDNEDEDSIYPRIAHVQSVNIKVEPLDDNEDPDQVLSQSNRKDENMAGDWERIIIIVELAIIKCYVTLSTVILHL